MSWSSVLRAAAVVGVLMVAGCNQPVSPADVAPGENPCNLVDCPPERSTCVVRQGQAVCVAPPTTSGCAAVLCAVGSFCVERNGQGVCVSRDPCANFRCPAGQHCTAPADAPMCVPDEPSCVCTLQYDPVCGADGKTYGNECQARCAGVAVVSRGECPVQDRCAAVRCAAGTHCELGECILDDPCTKIIDAQVRPLCAPNERCVVEQVTCVRAPCPPVGRCEPKEPCVCTREYAPVCGADGKTYGNRCMARCAGVAIVHAGECGTR